MIFNYKLQGKRKKEKGMKEEKCHYISQLLVLIVSRFNSFYIYYIHGHKYLWNVLKANECNPKHAKTYFSHENIT